MKKLNRIIIITVFSCLFQFVRGSEKDIPLENTVWILKTDSLGDTLWVREFAEKRVGWIGGNCAIKNIDGGYTITGDIEAGDLFLLKVDSLGSKLWERTYLSEIAGTAHSIHGTHDGGYILLGETLVSLDSLEVGLREVKNANLQLIRTDSLGNVLWQRTYGGEALDMGASVQAISGSGYLLIGISQSFSDYPQMWLLKTDSRGDTIWSKIYPGNGSTRGHHMVKTNDNNYIITGSKDHNVWLIKVQCNGDVVWDRTLLLDKIGYGRCIQATTDDGFIIAADINHNFSLIKTDSRGNILWIRNYGEESWNQINHVQQTYEGGYVFTGVKDMNCWLVKTDEVGNITWEKKYRIGYPCSGEWLYASYDKGYIVVGSGLTSKQSHKE